MARGQQWRQASLPSLRSDTTDGLHVLRVLESPSSTERSHRCPLCSICWNTRPKDTLIHRRSDHRILLDCGWGNASYGVGNGHPGLLPLRRRTSIKVRQASWLVPSGWWRKLSESFPSRGSLRFLGFRGCQSKKGYSTRARLGW